VGKYKNFEMDNWQSSHISPGCPRSWKPTGRLSITFTANANSKIPYDEEFATTFQFAICRLLFNTKRPVFVFVKNVNIYLKFLNRSATINSPVMFYSFFYVN